MHARSALLLLLLVPTACSRAGDPLPAEQFAEAYAEALCARRASCANEASYLVDVCKAESLATIGGDDVPRAVAAGRLAYDAAQARACVDGIAQTSCLAVDFDDATLGACFAALQGKVKTGEACDGLFECEKGLCSGDADASCPLTCPDVLGEGESCSLVMIGAKDCDTRAGLRCSGGVCVQPGGEGAACVDGNGCTSDLVCVNGACGPKREDGQGCARDASCAEGLFCNAASDEGGGCEPRLAEGATCAADEDEVGAAIRGVLCADGLVCKGAGLTGEGHGFEGGGVCAKPSSVDGACTVQPAGAQQFITGCEAGLVCDGGKCALPPAEGACGAGGVCRAGVAYCDGSNTCVALRADGEACQAAGECQSGSCDAGVCAPVVRYCHEG